jgi:hypothetical protein
VSLPHLLETSEPRLPGSACFTHMSEAAFYKLTTTLLQIPALRAVQALPVAMKRGFRMLVFIGPSPLPALTLRDVAANAQLRAGLEHFVGMVAFVRHSLLNHAASGRNATRHKPRRMATVLRADVVRPLAAAEITKCPELRLWLNP